MRQGGPLDPLIHKSLRSIVFHSIGKCCNSMICLLKISATEVNIYDKDSVALARKSYSLSIISRTRNLVVLIIIVQILLPK